MIRDSVNQNYNREDFPEPTPLAALKLCYRLLRGFEIRLVSTSNLKQSVVVQKLHELNLAEDFDNIRCFEDVTELKPKTELHLLSLDMMGVKAIRAVALETDLLGGSPGRQGRRAFLRGDYRTQGSGGFYLGLLHRSAIDPHAGNH